MVSEPFYDFAFEGLWLDRTGQNQVLQFFTFAAAYLLSSKTDKTPVKLLIWLVTLAVNFVFHIGFWSAGIILMLMFSWYLGRYKEKPLIWRFCTMTCILALFIAAECADDALDTAGLVSFFPEFAAGLAGTVKYYGVFLALPFLTLYNGAYGNPPAWFRVLYRYFYPAHLMLLSIAQLVG